MVLYVEGCCKLAEVNLSAQHAGHPDVPEADQDAHPSPSSSGLCNHALVHPTGTTALDNLKL